MSNARPPNIPPTAPPIIGALFNRDWLSEPVTVVVVDKVLDVIVPVDGNVDVDVTPTEDEVVVEGMTRK